MDQELCDFRTVRLVRRQREDHLNRADECAIGKRGQEQPAALIDLDGKAFERAARLRMGERRQIADGRASGDAVRQDGRERVELRV